MKLLRRLNLAQTLPYILMVGSAVGFVASSILIYDQVKIWRDPNFVPECNINPLLSCGSVINSGEGHVLGIPAPFLGLVMFTALGTLGLTILIGAKYKKWFWQGLQVAMIAGVAFALWLFWLSLYRINALCPFCLLSDAAVYIMAWYVTLYNLRLGHISVGKHTQRVSDFASRHHIDILVVLFLVIGAYILHHFWYYYGKYF